MANSMNSLPLELEVDILSRLSHKQLHDCRRVSKHWRGVISTQQFLLVYRSRHSLEDPPEGSSIIIDVLGSPLESVNVGENIIKINTQPTESHNQQLAAPFLIGTCNGLACFECQLPDKVDKTTVHKYLISNPATGAYKVVPNLVTKDYQLIEVRFLSGFGYDSEEDDYKVLRIDELSDKQASGEEKIYKCECNMYSLKANSWEEINTPYVNPCSMGKSAISANVVSLHSALHWFSQDPYCSYRRCNSINGFHLGTKEFFEIALPDGFEKGGENNLASIEGCLHLTKTVFDEPAQLCLWIMKEYGIKDSWTKVLSSSFNHINNLFVKDRFSIYAYFGDGNGIVFAPSFGNHIVCFNLRTRKATVVELPFGYRRVMSWKPTSYPLFISRGNISEIKLFQ